ncbi:MAG: YlxR family protein [Acidimicrobiia bacterium]|nr:YlxR family protein [Acidimicrobiia bacterium]
MTASRPRRRPARRVEPVRTCVGCRRQGSPDSLVRIARGADMTIGIGRTAPGRGAWLCAGQVECFEQAIARRAIGRALRLELSDHEIEQLRAKLYGAPPAGARPVGRASIGGG